jgi:lipopolysaccharide export system permease protein
MRQLEKTIDSLQREYKKLQMQSGKDIQLQLQFVGLIDTAWSKTFLADTGKTRKLKNFDELLPDSAKENINQIARNLAGSVRVNNEAAIGTSKEKEKNLRRHKIEWHRKIVLSLACILLFLIGAPLGSIIRKGGLGTPLIFAIIFFMIFYFSSTIGEKFAKEDSMSPFTGMWFSIFILLPIGLFLIYKALHDSRLFNNELYVKAVKQIGKLVRFKSKQ